MRLCAQTGLAGIVVQAGHSLLIDREQVRRVADERKLFVTGVDLAEKRDAT